MSLVLHGPSRRLEENVWGTMIDEICTSWGEDLRTPERTEASTDPSYSTSLVPWRHPDMAWEDSQTGSHRWQPWPWPGMQPMCWKNFRPLPAPETVVTLGILMGCREQHHAYPAGTSVEGKDEASPTLRWSEMMTTTCLGYAWMRDWILPIYLCHNRIYIIMNIWLYIYMWIWIYVYIYNIILYNIDSK